MGIGRRTLQLVSDLENVDGRVWTGNTINALPHGWGQVCFNGQIVWSHFAYGIPHFTFNMKLPDAIDKCSFIGKDGLVFSGYIDMGEPISGTVEFNDYKFTGLFNRSTFSPSVGTRFYQTDHGEASWMGRLDKHGKRQGAGVMNYADGNRVKGVWKDDEITDGDFKIFFVDKTTVDAILINGFSYMWPTKSTWFKIQQTLVKELFYDTLFEQRLKFQQHFESKFIQLKLKKPHAC